MVMIFTNMINIPMFLHQDGDIHRHMYLRDVVTAIEYDEQPPT